MHMCALPAILPTRMYDACMNYFSKMLIWLKLQRAFLYTVNCTYMLFSFISNNLKLLFTRFLLLRFALFLLKSYNPLSFSFLIFFRSLNILWSINPVGRWSSCLFYAKAQKKERIFLGFFHVGSCTSSSHYTILILWLNIFM